MTRTGPAFLAGMFFFMAYISWRKWPDILVDFGHELYVPWQLASGRILYLDIAHLNGPLSQYFNAVLFSVFGVSFDTLAWANLILLGLLIMVLSISFARLFDPLTSFAGCTFFILVFAFGQYVGIGNYNFVSPYSHEATHGIFLSAVLMILLWKSGASQNKLLVPAAGAVLGCILLTRTEIGFAAVAYSICYLGFARRNSGGGDRFSFQRLLMFTVGIVIPLAGFLLWFWRFMQLPEAFRAIGSAWKMLFFTDVADNRFFRAGMGLDDISGNILKMLESAAVPIVAVLAFLVADRLDIRRNRFLRVVIPSVPSAYLLFLAVTADLSDAARSFPLFMVLIPVSMVRNLYKSERNDHAVSVFAVSLAVYALALSGKILLNCRFSQYGFYLAFPSTLVLCIYLLWFFPGNLLRSRNSAAAFRLVTLVVAAIIAGRCTHISNSMYRLKTYPVGEDLDRFLTYSSRLDPRGPLVRDALRWIDGNLESGESLAVLPQGVMLNFLARRNSPSKYTTFMMTEMLAYGETTILDDFRLNPPDYIALVHKDTREFGVGFFGRDPDYGRHLMDWIEAGYQPVYLAGHEPLQNELFGIKILKRRSAG
ncbi:hypothetical protein JXA40_02315 [bacterium]|nr:hypothetical protein [candidate division CSSED10-310 bacterium]